MKHWEILAVTLIVAVSASVFGCNSNNSSTIPIDRGVWSSVSLTDEDISFGSYIAGNVANKVAIAGLGSALKPTVFVCSQTISDCTEVTTGLGADLVSVSALEYDTGGNLYGSFNISTAGSYGEYSSTLVKKLAAGADTWLDYQSFGGLGLSLDVSGIGILTSSSFSVLGTKFAARGAADLFTPEGFRLYGSSNFESSALNAITTDGKGTIYAAGPEYKTQAQLAVEQAFSKVWIWNPNAADKTKQFSQINMPANLLEISDMVTNGNGTVYISGVDSSNRGRVWAYANGVLTDTGIAANRVTALFHAPGGYLVAGGVDNVNYNGQVWHYKPDRSQWISLNLKNAGKIVNVSVNSQSNTIYAIGTDTQNNPTAWYYK